MRMRTLPKAVELLREEDPDTAITLTALRRLVKQKKIPVAMMGTHKPLVDVDALPELLLNCSFAKKDYSGVRPIT